MSRLPYGRLLVLLALCRALGAQQVRGTVAVAERPISGAVVLLVNAEGQVVARTVTRDDGRYVLSAPAAGAYTLRVLRIGYAPTVTSLTLASGETVTRAIAASATSVRLGAVKVTDERRCRVRPDSGSAAFDVWQQARTALLATQATAGTPLFVTVRVADRTLDASGRELAGTVRADSGRAARPFVSLSPDSLAAVGYVVRDSANAYTVWAPDPDVLLSESFANTHCLRLATRPNDSTVVGVAFEPAPTVKRSDVRGTLWLDRASAELRALEFRYANTDRAIEVARAGGDARFLKLADGRWLIDRWRIRAPVVQTRVSELGLVTPYVRALREFGGEVMQVRESPSAQLPLYANASPELRLTVATPPAPPKPLCANMDGAIVRGLVRTERATGAPAPGTQVDATWLDHIEVLPNGGGVSGRTDTRRTFADADGRFTLCGVPRETAVQVSATFGSRVASPPLLVYIARDRAALDTTLVVSRETALAAATALAARAPNATPMEGGTGAGIIAGVVRDAAGGAPLRGAEVRVSGGLYGAHADSLGRYRLVAVPPGRHVVTARRLGYLADSVDVAVEADSVVLEVSLPPIAQRLGAVTVEATATRARLQEFDQRMRARNGGYFIGDDELLKSADRQLSDMIRSRVPAVTLERAIDGSYYLSNRREQTRTVGMKNVPCVPRVFLNGMPMADSTVSSYTTGELAGVEFHDVSTTPVQYRRTGSQCGVLLLWSR